MSLMQESVDVGPAERLDLKLSAFRVRVLGEDKTLATDSRAAMMRQLMDANALASNPAGLKLRTKTNE